ncbi:MAG: alpha-2-macroglobulin family protein, partial [Candidatus Wallbacteria bacterium]|nr:alpha-2-macroglobulin family protein [Candidatus Wallbacteria bacterium]
FPPDHPVLLKLYNPLNRLVMETVSRSAVDGFYSFEIRTAESDPTGSWYVSLQAGNSWFSHNLRIETVAPQKIKVRLLPERERFSPGDDAGVLLHSDYLFGAPGAGLKSLMSFRVEPQVKTFARFQGFVFNNEALEINPLSSPEMEKDLDAQGNASFKWKIPLMGSVPSGLVLKIDSRVLEKGGRPVLQQVSVPLDHYGRFVGIKASDSDYPQTGKPLSFQVVLVDREGEPVAGVKLRYRMLLNREYWWWDYKDETDFRRHFRTSFETRQLEAGELISALEPVKLEYTPMEEGELLLEVIDGDEGHTAGYFIRAYAWGSEQSGRDAHVLSIHTDKNSYAPGETAILTFKSPNQGHALVSVEKGGRCILSRWEHLDGSGEIRIETTKEMLPNAYVFVTLIQPYGTVANDRPLRMYGIAPLMVREAETGLKCFIDMPDQLRPGEKFTVRFRTEEKKKVQFTLAIVDEGLLELTGFKTPSPWDFFYQKQGLSVASFDTFSDILGLSPSSVQRRFSLGGDGVEEESRKMLSTVKAVRFKPVAFFKGPHETDASGMAEMSFFMPNYAGSVRAMAVAADGRRYGCAQKSVPVRSSVVIVPALPRLLGPEDMVRFPVTVFAGESGIGTVEVQVKADGPVVVEGDDSRQIHFSAKGEQDVFFVLRARAETGVAGITVTAKSSSESALETTELSVRAVNPFLYSAEVFYLEPGQTVRMKKPSQGIAGTEKISLFMTRRARIDVNHRLKWLMRYPYGCLEQTISSVFPQLYFAEILKNGARYAEDADRNINIAISRMRRFQTYSGAFALWPGEELPDQWISCYAGHFLLEASRKGYHVPKEMLAGCLNFLKEQSRLSDGTLSERCYRLYLLALSGEPATGPMNLIRESSLNALDNTSRWLLSAAYLLSGKEDIAREIAGKAGLETNEYSKAAGTYGSWLRDKAIILEMLTCFKDLERGMPLFREIGERISDRSCWYSTQTTAFAMLAMGKFLAVLPPERGEIRSEVNIAGTKEVIFTTAETWTMDLTETIGDSEIALTNTGSGGLYGVLDWEGIPLLDQLADEASGMKLTAEFLDEDGAAINPASLKQGAVFWAHYRLVTEGVRSAQNLALIQIFPAGWEIENVRLTGEGVPLWAKDMRLNQERFADFRDDRAMWFFDYPEGQGYCDFLVKLNAVSSGEYTLPAAVAEGMYDRGFRAVVPGRRVVVLNP